jgi:uncharacterized OB-fold protein
MTRHLGDNWLLPQIDDLNRAWFTKGAISVQQCADCQTLQHPPDEMCCGCQGSNFSFRECSGEGHIESFVIVHQATHPALKDALPYAVVLVSLDDAPRVNAMGNVLNRDPSQLEIGQAVRAVFEEVEPEDDGERLLIPQWEVI